MPTQAKLWAFGLGLLVVSFLVGNAVAEGDYVTLGLMVLLILVTATIVMPGYEPILAFGILCPFSFPIPYVLRFPFVALCLGCCVVKYFITRALTQNPQSIRGLPNLAIWLLFGWVVLRYCINPVMPGLAIGTGNTVTGFRSYLNYGICFGLMLIIPQLIVTREGVIKLIRWLRYVSLFFVVLFVPMTLSKSVGLWRVLTNLGAAVGFFDNGWLRFIVLPGFGLLLLTVSLLPHLAPANRWLRIILMGIALAAIVMGGNRSSLAMAMAIFLCVAALRGKGGMVAASIAGIAATMLALYLIGENMKFRGGVGFLRVAALVSPRAAERSQADQTYEWRKMRWERAIQDIKKEPWLGKGYGGLNAIFTYGSQEDLGRNLIEIDVAAGSIHNGYIAGARAFGIPYCLLFIFILAHQIYSHAKSSIRHRTIAPVQSDLHAMVCAMLIAIAMSIYFGMDLNAYEIWFYVTVGVVISSFDVIATNRVTMTTVAESGHREASVARRIPGRVRA